MLMPLQAMHLQAPVFPLIELLRICFGKAQGSPGMSVLACRKDGSIVPGKIQERVWTVWEARVLLETCKCQGNILTSYPRRQIGKSSASHGSGPVALLLSDSLGIVWVS